MPPNYFGNSVFMLCPFAQHRQHQNTASEVDDESIPRVLAEATTDDELLVEQQAHRHLLRAKQ